MAVRKNNENTTTAWLNWLNSIEPFRESDVFISESTPEKVEIAPQKPREIPKKKSEPLPPIVKEESQKKEVDISALSLDTLLSTVRNCSRCTLSAQRNHPVLGEGAKDARLMFIGEGPGYDEDKTGRPFVGKAGKLLTKIIESGLGISREECYIANIVKCRPPQNRDPFENEAAACIPYLQRQIELIKPEIIVLLGRVAMNHLLGITPSLKVARADKHTYKNIPVIVTYHPAALLRNPALKKDVWNDLQVVIKDLELPGAK